MKRSSWLVSVEASTKYGLIPREGGNSKIKKQKSKIKLKIKKF